jgi:hypothetical protein
MFIIASGNNTNTFRNFSTYPTELLCDPSGLSPLKAKQMNNAHLYEENTPFLNLYLNDGCNFMQNIFKDHEILMNGTEVNCNLNTLTQMARTVWEQCR